MAKVYIYHHLGMGDIIVCNGLVRHLKEIYGEVAMFCKQHDYNNTQKMYRDDPNIEIIAVRDDAAVTEFLVKNNLLHNTIRVGFEKLSLFPESSFDISFYTCLGLPFSYRFDKFFYLRDVEIEHKMYTKYTDGSKYIFVHGDVDYSKIRTDLKIITNPSECGLFDLLKILENAEEIHLMESSIKCLLNSFDFEKPKLFYHQYVRNYPEYNNTKGIKPYEIIL